MQGVREKEARAADGVNARDPARPPIPTLTGEYGLHNRLKSP
jgi:hypothetical protein